ncbi:MAG: hypothetical protein AABY36_05160 [Campylobacterota bacterium]
MAGSKTNRVALYASAFLVVILVLFAILRDNADIIALKEAKEILKNRSVKSVVASEDFVYLKTEKDLYKIVSSQVTPDMFTDYKVQGKSGSSIVVYFLFLVLFRSWSVCF